MASHTHLGSPSAKSKQPYKVAGLRFNPKFISSISKSLSRCLEREREADEDDDAFPSLHPVLFASYLSFLSPSSPSPHPPRSPFSCLLSHAFLTLTRFFFALPSRGTIGMFVGASVHLKYTTTLWLLYRHLYYIRDSPVFARSRVRFGFDSNSKSKSFPPRTSSFVPSFSLSLRFVSHCLCLSVRFAGDRVSPPGLFRTSACMRAFARTSIVSGGPAVRTFRRRFWCPIGGRRAESFDVGLDCLAMA